MGAQMTEEMATAVMDASMGVMLEMQALNRIGQPRDIAEAALFLASDRSAQITGLDMIVDGGVSLGDNVNRQALIAEKITEVLCRPRRLNG